MIMIFANIVSTIIKNLELKQIKRLHMLEINYLTILNCLDWTDPFVHWLEVFFLFFFIMHSLVFAYCILAVMLIDIWLMLLQRRRWRQIHWPQAITSTSVFSLTTPQPVSTSPVREITVSQPWVLTSSQEKASVEVCVLTVFVAVKMNIELVFIIFDYFRSVSPRGKRYSRERSYSASPVREGSRSRSQSPIRDRSPPPYNDSRSPSPSPGREKLPPMGRSPSPDRSRSPDPRDYSRGKPDRDVSVSPWVSTWVTKGLLCF